MTLMKPWRHLRNLIEAWEKYQIQTCPNQEQGLEEMEKVYNPLHAGHCSYSQFPKRRKLVHDVFPARDDGEAETICHDIIRGFEQGPTQYGIAAVALHTRGTTLPHVHVLHDCSWSNGTCRCVIFAGFVRRPNRSSIWSTSASAWDLYHLVKYFNSEPRVLEYIKMGGNDWGRDVRNEVLGQLEGSGHEPGRVLEILYPKLPHSVACDDAHGGQTSGGDTDEVRARTGAKCRKRSKGASEESIYDWLRENPVSPLTNIVRTPKCWQTRCFGSFAWTTSASNELSRCLMTKCARTPPWTLLKCTSTPSLSLMPHTVTSLPFTWMCPRHLMP
ncbi:uncharacterized protein LOC119384893 [Rhipicephalus sanguineus]|uniref:uncharacterized protein LOC119384893 n=1 Tax=Rhipicephalus sanguineus TaxID=34632 RepID=UPI0020C4DBEA|nr:uncharacterized protein LOC119384893 [Rhipicephalus sanguineus]